MKRYARISQNVLCLIPRKAIAWIMLIMAVLTIFSFLAIEVRRLVWLKTLTFENQSNAINFTSEKELITDEHSSTKNTSDLPELKSASYDMMYANTEIIPMMELTVEGLLGKESFCQGHVFLLVLVTSEPHHFEQREAIRKTWSNQIMSHGLRTRTVFLVGRSENKFLNVLVKYEKDISNDILAGAYIDTYQNQTVKVLHGLKWALNTCKPSYVLRIDDDSFVNLPILVRFLSNPFHTTHILTYSRQFWHDSGEYIQKSNIPIKYINDIGYVLSLDALSKLVDYLDEVRLFFTKDVYTGGAIHLLSNARSKNGAQLTNKSNLWNDCNFHDLLIVHPVKPHHQKELLDLVVEALEECPKRDAIGFEY
ncbi:beta-1,3-galactosyltransferase 1-like [Parasteatoda tepidariorum]|uniref:beta-1,3-galactosyltransferase 1-like n=1 Tax=Parasteatoda tepidariorum TaxID=114398 RepID=UPI001C7280F7|nr:beta-1,3-galactosyltransferase 1-like [Parasteatoda tepidariorum]